MVPRPVVVVVVLALLIFLGADFFAQLVIPGHTASPVIDGAILALLGAILTGAKEPKPSQPDDEPSTPPAPGRHRGDDSP